MAEATSKQSHLTYTEKETFTNTDNSGVVTPHVRTPQHRAYRNLSLGEKNPRWREQVILGVNATTPFEGYSYNFVEIPYHTTLTCHLGPSAPANAAAVQVQWGNQNFTHPSYTDANVAAVPIGEANTAALGALVKDIRRKHTSFQGSTFVAELSKTIYQLRNPAKALRKGVLTYLHTVKRYGKRWRKLRRKAALDALTGTYLEATYGWSPLINDIDGIKETISERYKDEGLHERIWAHGVGEAHGLISKIRKFEPSAWQKAGSPKIAKRERYYATVKYSSLMGYDITGGQVQDLGFTPREWLPALLEVIPWSFVAAYFTNIDEIVTGLSYVGSNIRFTNKTIRQVWQQDFPSEPQIRSRAKFWYETAKPTATGSAGFSMLEGKRVRRSEYTGSLIPPPAFHMPGSGRKWLNLSALAIANRDALRALRD